jgi:AraC-like DNA-binding protein
VILDRVAGATEGVDTAGPIDESVRVRPTPALRSAAAWYSGYRQVGVAPAVHRGLPSPFLTLIFTIDDPMTIIRHVDPAQPGGDFPSLVGGLHATPAFIRHDGRQAGIQVALDPLAARGLLGLPAGELAGLDVTADTVLGRRCSTLLDQLQHAASWPERFAALDVFLQAAARRRGEPAPEVAQAWRRLRRTRGMISVADLAAEVGWSERHLSESIRRETGLAPKAAARVIRFDHARRLLTAEATRYGACPNLADLAVQAGYYDQAHLAREFGALAGCPPTVWLAEQTAQYGEFRNIQAEPDRAAAHSEKQETQAA